MNDDIRLERLLSDGMHELAPSRAPDRLRTSIKSETSEMAPRPRWLALIKEPPMRTNSRLAVGSPTWRVAVVIGATLLLVTLIAGASFAGAQIYAREGFIVDASGGGTHTTIAAAVADAQEGHEILVRPGTYEEAFELDRTLTIRGDGLVEDIVVVAPEGGPTFPLTDSAEYDPYAIHVTAGEPIVADMTFRGQSSELIVSGGSPTLEGLVLEDVGTAYRGGGAFGGSSILVSGPETSATIRDNDLLRGGPIALFDEAVATIERNRLSDGPHLFLSGQGPGRSVIWNEVTGAVVRGLNVHDTSGTEITDNTFTDSGQSAIRIRDGGDGLVARNTVTGGPTAMGIVVQAAHGLEVTENHVRGTQIGVSWWAGDGTVQGNEVTQNEVGIVIGGGSPDVIGNEACFNETGNFRVTTGAAPQVGENAFCDEPAAD